MPKFQVFLKYKNRKKNSCKANFEHFSDSLRLELQLYQRCSLNWRTENIPQFAGRLVILLLDTRVAIAIHDRYFFAFCFFFVSSQKFNHLRNRKFNLMLQCRVLPRGHLICRNQCRWRQCHHLYYWFCWR